MLAYLRQCADECSIPARESAGAGAKKNPDDHLLVEILPWAGSFGSLKAGLNPPLRGFYGQFFIPGLIDRRCNNVACGLNYLSGRIAIALNGMKKLAA